MKMIFLAGFLLFSAAATAAQIRSVYTGLSEKDCKTIEATDDEGGSYRGLCQGVAGHKLELIEGDLRQTINVIDAKGAKHELKFWEFFGGFSSVGRRPEWRMKDKTPIALIVRFNVSEDPEDSTKITSYLLVAKITDTGACVTDIIKPSRTQNVEARRAADRASTKLCRMIR
ncbi:MAG TPA: hypothetical protein PKD26_15225 [Pyrinomonadaceae bacterium]|nr:hypothetical protein [Pyrinomonadaceae bacterium]